MSPPCSSPQQGRQFLDLAVPQDTSIAERSSRHNCTPLRARIKKHELLLTFAREVRSAWTRTINLPLRRFKIRKYLKKHQSVRLIVGAGRHYHPDWLSTDIAPSRSEIVYLDVRRRLPFSEGSVDYIVCEHLIEHLSILDGQVFLAEAYRVLKIGGRMRIATPDMDMLLKLKSASLTDVESKYIEWCSPENTPSSLGNSPCLAINRMFYEWGHRFIYDQCTLRKALRSVGFERILSCRVGESLDENCRNMEHHQVEIGVAFNELETMVLEAIKTAVGDNAGKIVER